MPIEIEKLLDYPIPVVRQTLTRQQTAFYALSVGMGYDPLDDVVPVIIRINSTTSADFQADLTALREARFDALMLAKAETAADIRLVHDLLGRQVSVIALVETAAAFEDLAWLLRDPRRGAGRVPLETLAPEALGVSTTSTAKTLKVKAPAVRSGGIKVKTVAELVEKLKNEAKVI